MSVRKLLLMFIAFLSAIMLFWLGFYVLTEFIEDKFGESISWIVFGILLVPFLIYSIRHELKNKKELDHKKLQYMNLGKLLFKNDATDFECYYHAYLQSSNKKSTPVEILYEFAEQKGLSISIDWGGEENEGELEAELGAQIGEEVTWTNTSKLRASVKNSQTREGKFIIQLFKAIDKDLKGMNKKLLFFDLGTDAYVFTVTDSAIFQELTKGKSVNFHGVDKLRF
jgi:hypothetical protein